MKQSFFESDLVCRSRNDSSLEVGRVYKRNDRLDAAGRRIKFKPQFDFEWNSTQSSKIGAGDTNDNYEGLYGFNIYSGKGTFNYDQKTQILWDDDMKRCIGGIRHPQFFDIKSNDDSIHLVDRKFSLGQRVQSQGLHGTVVRSERLVTVKAVGSEVLPVVIPDVKLENIQPLTDLFYGVLLEFGGWIGQVTKVYRKALYKPELGPQFFTVEIEPPSWTTSRYVEDGDQIGLSYPYMTLSTDPYPGKRKKFGPSELARRAILINTESLIQNEIKCKELADQLIMCQSVEVTGVTVTWIGRFPRYLPSCDYVPNSMIMGDDLERVHPLYISPTMYLDKDGISNCLYGSLIMEELWVKEFIGGQKKFDYSCVSEMNETRCSEGAAKNEEIPVKKFLVQKLFSRHVYDVKWDLSSEEKSLKSEPMKYFGYELELEGSREHSLRNVFPNFFFCKRKERGIGFAEDEYGVVVQRSSKETVLVQWLRHIPDGHVECASDELEECSFHNVKKHPTFGDLRESLVVVASKTALECGRPIELLIGTVLSIDRWELGMVSVFCAVEKRQKTVWPNQIQKFKELTGDEQIRLKLRGIIKYKYINV